MLTGHPAMPLAKRSCRYIFFALYKHSGSAGHDRQLVAIPAKAGFRDLLKYKREPEEDTLEGRWGGLDDDAGGVQSNQRSKSMSWHDLVSRDGPIVSLRQLPLSSRQSSLALLIPVLT